MFIRVFSILSLFLFSGFAVQAETQNPEVLGPLHGMAMHGEGKYAADFKHFDYVNPDAPKGGLLKLSTVGSFDNLNPYIIKGQPAAGLGMLFETLLESSEDEAFSEYGLLAESFEMAVDRSWVTFNLRKIAKWHDGKPITAEDVVWTFNTLIEKGNPFFKAYYANVKNVEALNTHRVKFTFDVAGNRELPLIMGQMPVLPKHYWADKDFSATTLTPPLGSGPYKVKDLDTGRFISYERVKDWWGKDLPINKGRYNFDEIRFDFYRDPTVELQAFLAGEYDFRQENTAKNWATAYDVDAVKTGKIVKREVKHEIPTGMQGFIFNIRRDKFKDARVREALGLAFDFEWSNKQYAYGAYKRTESYFSNSELASSGLPEGRELEILEQFRGKIPEDVFTSEFHAPKTDGTGKNRTQLRKAMTLLDEAGWIVNDAGKRVHKDTGEALVFEIINNNAAFETWTGGFIQNLKKLGVEATFRVLDSAQYQNRLDQFDYDMIIATFGQSLSPGGFWGTEAASASGSRNYIGIADPVIDELIDLVIHAPSREELVYRTRALDRVLLWGHYVIPHWHIDRFRLAYWDKFAYPETSPKYGLGVVDTWWAK